MGALYVLLYGILVVGVTSVNDKGEVKWYIDRLINYGG